MSGGDCARRRPESPRGLAARPVKQRREADKKARLRSLKDLERSAATLAAACKVVLDNSINDGNVRARLSNELPRITLEKALEEVTALIRPANDVYYLALEERYRSVRRFLPDLLKHIRFGFSPAGKGVAASLVWLQLSLPRRKPEDDAPQEIVAKAWQQHITREEGSLDMSAYVFCTLDALPAAMSLCHPIGVMPTGVSACSMVLGGWPRDQLFAARWV